MRTLLVLASACVLSACSYFPAHTPGYDQPAPTPTPTYSDATVSELQYCLIVEQDVLDVFSKLNRKDELITSEFSKFERIDMRMKQLHGQAQGNPKIQETYTSLEFQKEAQGNSVLALFRDRAAIHSRFSLLNTAFEETCVNKSFQPAVLAKACDDPTTSNSFRCKLRF